MKRPRPQFGDLVWGTITGIAIILAHDLYTTDADFARVISNTWPTVLVGVATVAGLAYFRVIQFRKNAEKTEFDSNICS